LASNSGEAWVPVKTLEWSNDILSIIDQTLLPVEYVQIQLKTREEVWNAIKELKVRGAPAIGVCAAFGVLVGIREAVPTSPEQAVQAALETADYLATSRPTAVNLFWALDRMKHQVELQRDAAGSFDELWHALESEALAIWEHDRQICRDIGIHGASLIQDGDGILTHCNAGGLATSDYGTALAGMYKAHEDGTFFKVFADETRPLLQGARLTAWELQQADIDVTLICDSMAAQVMREGKIQLVITGADRIALNGDAANKIGTYGVALLAQAHEIPFYIAAPSSTFDRNISTGDDIPIENRDPSEIIHGFGIQTGPDNIHVYNPAFDVTPHSLIRGIITEGGILEPPYTQSIQTFLNEYSHNV
jgi:methylthioribose-1-phosphate isomerase